MLFKAGFRLSMAVSLRGQAAAAPMLRYAGALCARGPPLELALGAHLGRHEPHAQQPYRRSIGHRAVEPAAPESAGTRADP